MIGLWLLWVANAWARAGGGQRFGGSSGGGGGYSGGGYSGGGSSSGGGGDLFLLLYWLVFEHPVLGIPCLAVAAYLVFKHHSSRLGAPAERTVTRSHHFAHRALDLSGLRARDPDFSRALFLDLARLLFVRAHEERGRGNFAPLAPYFSDDAVGALRILHQEDTTVESVIIGSAAIIGLVLDRDETTLNVSFTANMVEGGKHIYAEEQWRFSRSASAKSLGPDKMRSLSCPNCGSAMETKPDGSCVRCDTVIVDGRLQWRAVMIRRGVARAVPAIDLQLGGGGIEVGTDMPTIMDPGLGGATRALRARYPLEHWVEFRARATHTFTQIQDAWTSGQWEKARPYETDFLFQQHRYWIERYRREGLKNELADITITDVVPARVELDPFCESITVRIYARMRDWTINRQGEVVGGDPRTPRVFSEYWTFVRSAGRQRRGAQPDQCPSCGAALDKVSETGVCGYCDAKVTGGEFDWVLSAIDQDEVYMG